MSTKNVMFGGSIIVAILLIGSLVVTATILKFGEKEVPVTGFAVATTISGEQAIAIASNAIEGTVEEVELGKQNGVLLYSVEIINDKGEHEIKIDPNTGEIVSIQVETDVGMKELSLIKTKITEEQAKSIALGQVQGTVTEVEVEKVNGRYLYEIEIQKGGSEFDVAIDLVTGEVVGIEEDVAADDDEGEEVEVFVSSQSSGSIINFGSISKDEAIEIAEDRLSSGFDFEEIGSGRYRGKDVWEVEFEDDNEEAEVIIDKQTGEILEIEYEDEDDDDD